MWVSDELKGYVDFPYAEQFFMVERRTEFFNGKKRHEIVYGISSLTAEQASAQQLLELNRGHWEIENRVHYVRDVTFDEDRSQVRKGNGAQVMASIRNLVIAILRLIGFRYIPDAIRYFVFRIPTALTVLGI
ncbi:MAG: ISAs1 family transposase [Candidatus Methanospirareceae archaeon]